MPIIFTVSGIWENTFASVWSSLGSGWALESEHCQLYLQQGAEDARHLPAGQGGHHEETVPQ